MLFQSNQSTSVLFDLDGTLIDSAPSLLRAFSSTLKKHNISPVCPLVPSLIGPPLKKILSTISAISDEKTLDILASSFRQEYDQEGFKLTQVYDGIEDALFALHDNKVKLYLVTNKRKLPTLKILEMLGWQHLFEAIYTIDAPCGGFSNKTAAVADLVNQFKLDLDRSIFVGDTDGDCIAAKENGMRFAGVTWGYGDVGDGFKQPSDLYYFLMTN